MAMHPKYVEQEKREQRWRWIRSAMVVILVAGFVAYRFELRHLAKERKHAASEAVSENPDTATQPSMDPASSPGNRAVQ